MDSFIPTLLVLLGASGEKNRVLLPPDHSLWAADMVKIDAEVGERSGPQ
jgi:hypothetical protein